MIQRCELADQDSIFTGQSDRQKISDGQRRIEKGRRNGSYE